MPNKTIKTLMMGILGLGLLPWLMGQGCSPAPTDDLSDDGQLTDGNSTDDPGDDAGDNDASDDADSDNPGGNDRVVLNIVKLNYSGTTERGPAVGDGVLAFDTDGGRDLAWLRAGQTTATAVPAPPDMKHDRDGFAFGEKKLVIRDRYSGSLYVFDTETEDVEAISASSINMGGIAGPNYWAVSGNLLATINESVTTTDGAGKRIKVVDISQMGAFAITPFDLGGIAEPDAIDIDAENQQMVVRAGVMLYIYDVTSPDALPARFNTLASGGSGSSDVRIRGGKVAYFDDDGNFKLLDVETSRVVTPARNPGRASRGLALAGGLWAYFAMQTEDDGSSIDQFNRALIGSGEDVANLIDPPGDYVNGENISAGRVGFGATLAITPDGQYVFVAGETIVGVDFDERLYVSVNGDAFKMVADPDDPDNALRATGVAASDNLVAFLIPDELEGSTDAVAVGYAVLSP